MTHTDTVPESFVARRLSGAVSRITIWIVCVAVLGMVFLPVLAIPYAHHDQYRHFRDPGANAAFKQNCTNDPQYRWLYILGRPIAAESECIIFEHTTRLSDLIWFRFWVLAILALAAASYAELLRKQMSTVAAVTLSLATFTLPGAQNAVFMTNLANAIAPLLATLSYLALDKAQDLYQSRRRTGTAAWVALAAAALLSALLTYPFLALFFFCGSMANLLFAATKSWHPQAVRLFRDAGFFGAIAVLYWSIAKLALFTHDPGVLARMPAAYRPILDLSGIPGQFAFMLKDVYPRILTLWYVYPSSSRAACVLSLMGLGFALNLYSTHGQGVRHWRRPQLAAMLVVILLLIEGAAPFLVIRAIFLYRLFFATGAMIVMLLFWSVTQIILNTRLVRFFPAGKAGAAAGIAICAIGCIIAAINTTLNTENSLLEFAYIKAQIAAARSGEIQRVHIVQPRKETSFNGLPVVTDEFNRPTTAYAFDIPDVVRVALTEMRAQSKSVADGTDWIAKGNARKACEIRAAGNGGIRIIDENGISRDATLQNGEIEVAGGRSTGVVAPDLMSIHWSNGTMWARRAVTYELAGDWRFVPPGDKGVAAGPRLLAPVSIKSLSGTALLLTGEQGNQASATQKGSTLDVPDWRISGVIMPNRTQIRWSNGALWEREFSDESSLDGAWTMLDAYGTGELLVTTSQSGEPVLRSANMVVVDMNTLLDSVLGWPTPPRGVR